MYKRPRDLPIVICRPSIVVATYKAPFAGWIDNANGPSGFILGIGRGLIRSILGESKNVADLIPADTFVNLTVSLGWFANVYRSHRRQQNAVASLSESLERDLNVIQLTNTDYGSTESDTNSLRSTGRSSPSTTGPPLEQDIIASGIISNRGIIDCGDDNEMDESKEVSYCAKLRDHDRSDFEYKLDQFERDVRARLLAKNLPEDLADVPVFHCTSGKDNPIIWGYLQAAIVSMWALYPSIATFRFPPMRVFTNNRRIDYFWRATLHYIPAYVLDL